MIIGIDFGTCFSSVSVMSGMVPDNSFLRDETGMGMPTVFLFDAEKGAEVFGNDCESPEYYRRSGDIVRYVKRTIREDESVLGSRVVSGGRSFTYSDIIEHYIGFLIREVRRGAEASGSVANTEVEAVAVTVPVAIAGGKMMAVSYNRVVHDAVQNVTGLPDDRIFILEEPVAAALSYIYTNGAASAPAGPQTVMVFDLGGGTLDVSVVRYDPATRNSTILAKEGDLELGGNDWDAVLANLVRDQAGVVSFPDPEERAKFERRVTALKINLSRMDEDGISFRCGGKSRSAFIERAEFEAEADALVRRALGVTAEALYRAWRAIEMGDGEVPLRRSAFDIGPGGPCREVRELVRKGIAHVDRVVLVGGGSNVPAVRRALVEVLGIPDSMVVSHNPSKAISMGAGIYAKLMADNDGDGPSVTNIISHSYGVNTTRNKGTEEVMCVMIPRGTPFPADGRLSASRNFWPNEDDQTSVAFKVLESDTEPEECDHLRNAPMDGEMINHFVIHVDLPEDYHGKATSCKVETTLSITSDGLMEITVRQAETGTILGYASNQDF